jgi:Cu/Ag efflux protein CusF
MNSAEQGNLGKEKHMARRWFGLVAVFALFATALLAQEGPQRGKIKKVDADKGIVTITVDGKDQDVVVTEDTRLADASGKDVALRLQDKAFKEGAEVLFKAEDRGGKKVLIGMKLGAGGPGPAGSANIRTATIKKIDLDKMVLTLAVDGKERDFLLTEETRVLGAAGSDIKERLKAFKEGAEVQFLAGTKDGKDVLQGLKLAGDVAKEPLPKVDTIRLKPLTELGTEEYKGYKGGLYPDGKNERPAAHEAAGVALAKQVEPLDADGKPSENGKIVLLSVGMSNTSQASEAFKRLLDADKEKNPHLLFVNGAQGGMTAEAIQNPDDKGSGTRYWTTVDDRLKNAGVTRAQVRAIWIKQADARPNQGFPKYAQTLQEELANVVRVLPVRFPNVKLVYLSSRTYGGYAKTPLNPEPYAYESGFSVKWLIEQQLKGDPALNADPAEGAVKAPWLSWGPYLWANGSTKRADGFSYDEGDFSPQDGTHESPTGQAKVGKLLMDFFKSDSTTKPWFVGR